MIMFRVLSYIKLGNLPHTSTPRKEKITLNFNIIKITQHMVPIK